MVRGKFYCHGSLATPYGGPGAREVVFRAQWDDGIEENARYAKATPSGEIKIVVDNPAALEQFVEDKCYYVDFTPAE